ncbi:MAG: filamentous hemagglutinin N-terminal domain-containing protein [Bacteroidetes bacterium]|nr:filamentous hemagglutinin N-terminal domain-containing protein [Bacteroidota bacterium]
MIIKPFWDIKRHFNLLANLRNFVFLVLIFILVFYPPLVLAGTPVVGLLPDGTTNTGVDRSPNGTPLLNISAPNASGMSHNKFTDYNVSPENLVINNFKGSSSQMVGNSNLAGVVYANPNLANGSEARVILNEVTSTHSSFINGYTEVFGGRADLIIANPNGIAVSGAGFINTSRLALVAGRPNLGVGGNVVDYTLSGNSSSFDPANYSNLAGKVLITSRDVPAVDNAGQNIVIPLGLDVSTVDYADIIARAVKVTGNIYANNLGVQTGNNRAVQAVDGSWSVVSDDGVGRVQASAGQLAIDSSYLGGMYAGRISLVATESGLGVAARGDLVADVGNIDLGAKGDVSYANIVSKNGDVNIAVGDNAGNGNGNANANVNNANLNSVDSSALISAKGVVNLAVAGNINNWGEISGYGLDIIALGNVNNSGNLIGRNNLSLGVGGDLGNSANIYSTNSITITAGGSVNNNSVANSEGLILSNNILGITAAYLNNFSLSTIKSDNILNFNIANLTNNGAILATNQINFNNLINLTNSESSASIYSKADLNLNLANLTNTNNAVINSDGNVIINASNKIINDHSLILAIGDLNISAKSLANQNTNSNPLDSNGKIIFDYGLVTGGSLTLQTDSL